VSPAAQLRRRRVQELTRIYTVMSCLLILLVAQVVLLLVGVEGFLRGEQQRLLAPALASGACFAAAARLMRSLAPAPPSTR